VAPWEGGIIAARKKASARADVSCAVCGKPLELWDATTALDGRTVCASGCLGGNIVACREHPAYQGDDAGLCGRCGETPDECNCHLSADFDGDL
jgi:hypothetical protein